MMTAPQQTEISFNHFVGQKLHRIVSAMSAYPLIATEERTLPDVSNVPISLKNSSVVAVGCS
jgi:hypothetical protein